MSNLLRSPRWSAKRLADTLWQQADAHVQALRASGEEPFLEWDGRVLEKPETIKNDDLCALRSSKARRLKRIRPGFFNPPGGRPICVPGLHWLGLLVLGRAGAPTVAAMHGWTRRGERASDQQPQVQQLLRRSVEAWGGDVRHLWDREFASGRWLRLMLDVNIRFVLRWKKRQKLLDGWGEARAAWEITRGKRWWEYRHLRDSHTGERHKVGVLAVCVTHPEHAQPLWLVVARPGRHYEPWYLLTSDPIRRAADAWAAVFAYGRRWRYRMCLARKLERTGDGKPARLDLGAAREAVADGHAGVCVLTVAAGERVGGATQLAVTRVAPPDRQTEPRGCGSALSLAFGAQPPMASLSPVTRHAQIKFGMTHV